MTKHAPLILGGLIAAFVAAPILAQQQAAPRNPVAPECRAEIIELCGTDRSQVRACLQQKRDQLSDKCKAELRTRAEQMQQQRGTAPAPAPSESPAPQL